MQHNLDKDAFVHTSVYCGWQRGDAALRHPQANWLNSSNLKKLIWKDRKYAPDVCKTKDKHNSVLIGVRLNFVLIN